LSEISFEKSMERLSEIVKQLENEKIDVDSAITLYEEGLGLSKALTERLENAELKIKKLRT